MRTPRVKKELRPTKDGYRTIRVPEDVYLAVVAVADHEDRSHGATVRRAINTYAAVALAGAR